MATKNVQKVSDAVQHAEYLINILHGVEYLKDLCRAAVTAEQEVNEAHKLRDEAKDSYVKEKEQHKLDHESAVHQYQHDISLLQNSLTELNKNLKVWDENAKKHTAEILAAHEAQQAEYAKQERDSQAVLVGLREEIAVEENRIKLVIAKRKELQGI